MKKFLTITMIILFSTLLSAQSNYESNWKKVQEFESKGLPKSALAEVETIFNTAKASNNSLQIIKSLLFKSKYALTLEENSQLNIINNIKEEILNVESPEKNILESIVANLYWQYFQNNRHQFYNRSHTAEKVDESDFRTWDLHTIFKEIDKHFKNSLENGLILQNTKLSKFDVILHKNEGSKTYRPTVFDFISHKALSFYKTGESNLAQPVNKFEINNPSFLGDNKEFLKADFTSKDKNSQKLKALKIFKRLTSFHKENNNIPALVKLTLQRLNFVKQNARLDNKEEVYFETLKILQEQHRDNEVSTEIDFRIAQHYFNQASKFNSTREEKYQFQFTDALKVCNKAILKFPKSNGAKKCLNLKNQIILPSFNLKNEDFVTVNRASRILITYKNINKIFFRVFKSTREYEENLNRVHNDYEKLKMLKNLEKVTEFSNTLKNKKDYQNHSTEVILPKLAQGEYVILASTSSNFEKNSNFAYSYIQATSLALVESVSKGKYTFQVVNRETGKPINKAKFHIKNYQVNKYNKAIDKTFISDENGFVNYIPTNHHYRVEVVINKDDDKGSFRYFRLNKYQSIKNNEFVNNKVFLFTDRSIYRPSQTVYFKGIAVEQRENKSEIIANNKIKVSLKDANYQEVKSLELVTNEFGSFTGEFILPNNGLTGNFQIEVVGVKPLIALSMRGKSSNTRRMYGSIGFSVEEYKRPKFSAKFNKITDVFKLNDKITIKGQAIAYAGSNITDAKVVYRVKRNVQYPKWRYWYKPHRFSSEAQEITHGETKTNEKGEFEITFLAKPDTSINKKDLPVFSYEISADITDINGETRSTSTIVKVGYHSQTIDIVVGNRLDKSKKDNKLTINTKNLNGEFVSATGTLKIYKIKAPKNVFRNRPWGIPTTQSIYQEEFERLFPNEVYKKPTDELGEEIFLMKFDTSKEKEIQLNKIKKWLSGAYIVIAEGKDNFGQTITDKARFTIFSNEDKKVADKQFFEISLDKKEYKIGDEVILKIGTASENMTVVVRIEKENKIVDTQLIHLNNEIKTLCIPVEEIALGGFGISYNLVNFNSFIGGNILVNVPYEKMDLEIETLTFRDKLQPAQEETWSFKIKGTKKDKVVAEVLTSMYDASLDQFRPHKWQFKPIRQSFYFSSTRVTAGHSFGVNNFRVSQKRQQHINIRHQGFDSLNWFGLHFGYSRLSFGNSTPRLKSRSHREVSGMEISMEISNESIESAPIENDNDVNIGGETSNSSNNKEDFSNVKIRTNFNETAFFFPQLKTDKEGNIRFSFTTPESLTKWKMQLLAHTKKLKSAIKTLETVTQKELMVLPNLPRFLRQGDKIIVSSKIANLTDIQLSGQAKLELFDAITNKPIDTDLKNELNTKAFNVDANGNTNVSWTLYIPENIQAVQYKIVAKAGNYSDGEQNILPVLSNRMLVTETMPMWIRSSQTKTFNLEKLKNTTSTTRKNHKLTLEITSNPAWYAVKALPYLMEFPHDCAEQVFSRYYANTLASHIANSNPRIQNVFNQWKNSDALLSNLEKNQELKSIIIQETPWLRDAQSETEQKKRIALLFDLNKMKNEQENAINKLKKMQMSSGGFPWFKGARYENRFITQHIVAGFGHLDKLGALKSKEVRKKSEDITKNAIAYLDAQILKDYNKLLENAEQRFANNKDREKSIKEYLAKNHSSHFQVHYLYTRSFFKDIKMPKKVKIAYDYYTNQTYKYWLDYNLYSKGLIALIAKRNDNNAIADAVINSLKENAITSEELGMYWKENSSSYHWYQAPIETQALMIEVFSEVGNDIKTIDNLKIWLLKNKQTNSWKTTKATSIAIYALLLQGTDWLKTTEFVEVKIANKIIKPLELENTKVEAGTGYFKTSWSANEITPEMAKVTISKEGEGIAWGAMYWQYFEDLDKITFAETPLKLKKKLFLKSNTDRGKKITEITKETKLQLGDLVRVRIELRVDRAMEFIHMKDMRAAGFEPVNVLSQFKWQDGLGYYESTKDASTNFFIDFLPKGVYVFEYDLRVNNKGDFSNGITTIQSMYAPEFSSHSEGVRVKIGGF